jgi:hypothetical protein
MSNIEYYRNRSRSSSRSRGSFVSRSHRGGSYRDASYRRITSPPAPIKFHDNKPHKPHNPNKPHKPDKLPKEYRQTSTTYTMGTTGGAPFWGWTGLHYVLYPIVDFASIDAPTIIDLGFENNKKNKDKNI